MNHELDHAKNDIIKYITITSHERRSEIALCDGNPSVTAVRIPGPTLNIKSLSGFMYSCNTIQSENWISYTGKTTHLNWNTPSDSVWHVSIFRVKFKMFHRQTSEKWSFICEVGLMWITIMVCLSTQYHINGLVQDCSNSTKPSILQNPAWQHAIKLHALSLAARKNVALHVHKTALFAPILMNTSQ